MAKSKITSPRWPYPGRVPHHADEPAYGLLVRTAYHNGSRLMYTVFEKYGLCKGQTVWDVDPDIVARFCQADLVDGGADAVRAASPRVDPKHVAIFDERFLRDQFSVLHRRWCPACLEEKPYHRVWWDTPYVSACPDHGIRIVENCGCAKPPKWRRSYPTSCTEGHDFRESPREPAPPWEIALSRYIRDRLLGRPRPGDALLDSLPSLGDAIAALDRIGQASLDEKAGLMKLRRELERTAIAAEGYRIIAGFPAEFERLLDRLVADDGKQKHDRRWGVEKAYGNFHIWVGELPKDNAFGDALRSVIRDHARANVVIKSGHAVAGGAAFDIPGIDMATAARAMGVTFERFRPIASATGLIPGDSLRGRPARLDADKVDELAAKLKGNKSRQQIAKELDIAPLGVAKLIRAGLIPAIVDGKTDRENRLNIWILPGAAACDLVERLVAGKPASSGENEDLIPITIAHKIFRRPLSELLRLVLDGTLSIRAVDPGAKGLNRALVSKSDATAMPGRPPRPGLSPYEFAREIGLHADTVHQLIANDAVQTEATGRVRRIVDGEAERFRATYATTTALSKEFDLPKGRSVMAVLNAAGVRPAFPRPSFRQVIYLRADAEPALAAAVAEAARKKNSPLPANGLDRYDAARRMGLDAFVVTRLVAEKLLPAYKLPRGFIVAPDDADAFMRAHATSTELAKRMGKKRAAASIAVLRRAGVAPVVGPPTCSVTLYPRTAAEEAIDAHIGAGLLIAEINEQESAEPVLTAIEASKEIRAMPWMLGQLADAGFLERRRRGRGLPFTRDSVARFKKAYVLANELGALIGRPDGRKGGKTMTDLLTDLGVEPVCRRPEFQTFVFRRDEAVEALARHFATQADKCASDTATAEARAKLVTLREAQRRLGISSNMGSSLVREGFLRVEKHPSTILVSPDEIARFAAAYITPDAIASMIGKQSAIAATTLLTRLGVKPVAGPPQLRFQLFDRPVVEHAISEWKRDPSIEKRPSRDAEDFLYAGDVARRLKTIDTMVPALIQAGLLRADTTGKATIIARVDFDAFQSEYAMSNEFMDAFGVGHAKGVTKALAVHGVTPVAADRLPRALFRRKEVERVVRGMRR